MVTGVSSAWIKELVMDIVKGSLPTVDTLIAAVQVGDKESIISILKDLGKEELNSRHESGLTPLTAAIYAGGESTTLEIMKLVLDSGFDVDYTNNNGAAALHIAAFDGNLEALSLLAENHATIDKSDNNGWTPLIHALMGRHTQCAERLFQKEENVNVRVPLGNRTILMLIAAHGDRDGLSWLLDKGAKIDNVDESGHTALEIAKEALIRATKEKDITRINENIALLEKQTSQT